MASGKEIQTTSRLQIFNTLIIKFDNEYQNLLKVQDYSTDEKIEITEHLLKAIDYIQEYVTTKDSKDWKKYADSEAELLKKYRGRLKAYTDFQFYKYFDFRLVLAHKFIITQEQFNSMKSAAEQSLSDEEIDLFLSDAKHLLSLSLHFLYLSDTGNAEPTPLPVTLNETDNLTDEPDKDVTKARQLLTIYYFLKASFGIEARDKNSASGIVRFIHLMTGTKFTTIQNSDIYKKYLRMPNYKTDSRLIEDLKFIRPYFVDLGLESAIKMVDEEIKRAIKELPYNERKKYKSELE